jgi:hypothetical protein
MTWYQETLKRNGRGIISGAIFVVTAALAALVWHYAFSKSFVWTDIQPISTPIEYAFYSALVFMGPGAFLYYHTDFYKNLWSLRKIDRGLHKGVKRIIWLIMMTVMLAIVIAIVYLINTIISFFYNAFRFILLFSPPLGIGLITGTVTYLLFKKDFVNEPSV